jgi:hypothetical protein
MSISNFKAFSRISLPSLSLVNVIGGMNNVGKTALLEAIYLLVGAENIDLVNKINAFRGLSAFSGDAARIREAMWGPLFHNLQVDHPITIEAVLSDSKKIRSEIRAAKARFVISPVSDSTGVQPANPSAIPLGERLQLVYRRASQPSRTVNLFFDEEGPRIEPPPGPPPFPGYFVGSRPLPVPTEDADLFGRLEAVGRTESLLHSLAYLEPKLTRLSIILNAGVPMIHGDVGLGRMIPLLLMGDGIRRMTTILLAIANAPNGIVLVDDIELGIHHSNISKAWHAILDAAARYQTQLFVTSHSYEWIRGAASASGESFLQQLALHRLERRGSTVELVTYDRESLEAAMAAELEVR